MNGKTARMIRKAAALGRPIAFSDSRLDEEGPSYRDQKKTWRKTPAPARAPLRRLLKGAIAQAEAEAARGRNEK